MLKLNKKIKSVSSYITLISYLIIIIINAAHYHNIDLNNLTTLADANNTGKVSHIFLNDDFDFCPVQFAYNVLQNTIFSSIDPLRDYEKRIEDFTIQEPSSKLIKTNLIQYSLRAPPKFS